MRFPSRRLLAAGLLTAGLCVWAVFTATAVVGEAPRGTPPRVQGPPAVAAPAPASPGSGELVTPAPAERAPPAAPVGLAPPEAEWELPAQRIVLRVRFEGEPPAATDMRLEVSSAWPSERGLRLSADLDERLDGEPAERAARGEALELDVSSLFRFATPRALVLRATSGELRGLTVVPSEHPEEGLDARIWLDAGVRGLGRVVPPGPGRVSAFLVLDGAPTGTPVAAGEVDADGSFELPLPAGNDYALCAHGSGRPGTLVAHVGFAPSQPLPPVFLPPEMVIEGSLGLRQSWERATVTAELVGASGLFVVGGGELTWLDGSFEWRARVGALEPDGQFRISGLAPALYDLGVSGVQTRERAAVGRLPSLAVRAPAGGVDLAPRMARVRLRRERDGGPVASSSISLVQDFGQGGSSHLTAATDAHGVAEFWLDPDAPAWVQGRESARFVPRELDARAPHPVPDADRPASTGWGWSGE